MPFPSSLLAVATGFSVGVDTTGTGVKIGPPNALDPEVIRAATAYGTVHTAIFFAAIAAVVFIVVWGRVRRSRMQHETIRMLVEKGVPIPPELFQPPVRRNDLRKALVWIAVGLGFGALGLVNPSNNQHVWAVGLIPILIGVAFLIAWKVDASKEKP